MPGNVVISTLPNCSFIYKVNRYGYKLLFRDFRLVHSRQEVPASAKEDYSGSLERHSSGVQDLLASFFQRSYCTELKINKSNGLITLSTERFG